jgi:N6-adenosine-specific RNA methylase IME4
MPGRDGVANRARTTMTKHEIGRRRRKRKRIERIAPSAAQEFRDPGSITIGDRHRKEYGDLAALARSINERGGLIHPPSITPRCELIAGERRLRAWQLPECKFHEQPIPVTIIDIDSIIAGERDENDPDLRKAFTPSEAVAIARAMRPHVEEQAKLRQRQHGGTAPGRRADGDRHSGQIAPSVSSKKKPHRTRELIAKAVGKGARTLDKAEAIVAAAEAEPEKFSKLVEAMDRTGRVNGPFKRLRNAVASDAIKKEPPGLPMHGPYRAGIIDPPWASEPGDDAKDHGARGYYPYPTMTPEQIAALDVPSILHADASVWMWITNFHLLRGDHLGIAKAWDLKPVALLTWVKRKWGQGQRARGTTEHLIQMVRGDVLCLGYDTRTDFTGEGGEHSQKPIEAYALVEKLSPAPRYFEMFSRGAPRENWDMHGNEIGKHALAAGGII